MERETINQENEESISKTIYNKYNSLTLELTKILPIGYLFMIIVGMTFSYHRYIEFGINIFQYASVFDFLISPLEDVYVLLFTFLSIIIVVGICAFDYYFKKRFPKLYTFLSFGLTKNSSYSKHLLYLYGLLMIFYVYLSAEGYGRYSKKIILNQSEISIKYNDNEIIRGKQIGKTSDMIFIVSENGNTKIIPIQSLVKEISIP